MLPRGHDAQTRAAPEAGLTQGMLRLSAAARASSARASRARIASRASEMVVISAQVSRRRSASARATTCAIRRAALVALAHREAPTSGHQRPEVPLVWLRSEVVVVCDLQAPTVIADDLEAR